LSPTAITSGCSREPRARLRFLRCGRTSRFQKNAVSFSSAHVSARLPRGQTHPALVYRPCNPRNASQPNSSANAQRNALRHRGERQQSRSFAPPNQRLRRTPNSIPALLRTLIAELVYFRIKSGKGVACAQDAAQSRLASAANERQATADCQKAREWL